VHPISRRWPKQSQVDQNGHIKRDCCNGYFACTFIPTHRRTVQPTMLRFPSQFGFVTFFHGVVLCFCPTSSANWHDWPYCCSLPVSMLCFLLKYARLQWQGVINAAASQLYYCRRETFFLTQFTTCHRGWQCTATAFSLGMNYHLEFNAVVTHTQKLSYHLETGRQQRISS